jgi:hypothetical protein
VVLWTGVGCEGMDWSGMWGYGLEWAGSGYRKVVSTCECGNEPSGSIKCE